MLLELAVGDAYGAGFEYVSGMLTHNDLSRYVQHPRHREIRPGMYTDDTQMSIAVAELVVSGQDWTPLTIASHFVAAFKRDPRTGYASRFYHFLREITDGADFLAKIRPNSDKSGAAMRAGPIGVYPTISEVLSRCRMQAAVTHNTTDGIDAACAAALMTHYFLYRLGPKDRLAEFLNAHVAGQWDHPWTGKVKSKGWMSVRAAITAVMAHDRLSDLLRACVAFTGDVDTVAAIALATASCAGDYEPDLPPHLIAMLENGAYGREYLEELDTRLLGMVDATQSPG